MIGLKKLILEQQDDPDKIKIKTFQDWLDINHPNWIGCTDASCTNGKQLNKGRGYGIWGDNSNRMWYFKYEGTKTYGDWFEANYDANNPTSVLTKKISGSSSNLPNQNKNVTNKSENVFNTYRKQFVFKDGNGTKIPIKYNELIGDSIDGFLEKGFDESTSFIAGILSIDEYKNLIASMIGPNDLMTKYEGALTGLTVFFEHVVYNKRKGLITLLEQNFTEFVVNKGIPTRKTSTSINQPTYTNRYDQLYTIVRGTKPPYEKGQRSPFIGGPKQEIGHTDTSELFDQSFEDNLRKWQDDNGIDVTGKLDKDTICEMYPRMCENINKSSTGESEPKKTEAKPQSEVLRVLSPYLMRFSKTARPSKDNCKLLIDNYAYQAKNYRKNKEAGIESDVTSQELTPIKKQIMACLNNHPVLKLQLRDMSEMKKSDSPFYLYAEPESSDQAAVNEIPNVLDKPLVISIKEFSTEKPDGEIARLYEFRKDKDNKTLLFKINNGFNGKYVCGASTFENGGYRGEQVKMTQIGIDTLKKICRKLDYSLGISYYTSNDPDETPQYGKLYEFTKNGNKLNFKFKEQNNEDYYFNCGGGEKLIYSQKTKKTIRIGDDTSKELQNKCGFLG